MVQGAIFGKLDSSSSANASSSFGRRVLDTAIFLVSKALKDSMITLYLI